MMNDDDPRKAPTLGEAAQNADGTYNAYRALSWLSSVTNPSGLTVEQVMQIGAEVKAKLDARNETGS